MGEIGGAGAGSATRAFLAARDFLFAHREDYDAAYRGSVAPELRSFNWALDVFDVMAAGNTQTGLWVVDDAGNEDRLSFADLSERSNRLANYLRRLGVRRADRVLVMLPNVAPLWEVMLAMMKLGAVTTPATTLLTTDDLRARLRRGGIRHVLADAAGAAKFAEVEGSYTRVAVGGAERGWTALESGYGESARSIPDGATAGGDPLLLYFTSGTTAEPKLVLHTHTSYPVGHLSTMYWIGVREGDVHMNVSSPGWAKHAWSSFFAPWNAGATVFVHNYDRFVAKRTLEVVASHGVTTLCAAPTVWRMLILEDLKAYRVALRELVEAGEPLNPEVIEKVRSAWGLTIRDGYGQTETTCQVGNSPGQSIKPGSMGRPMPGYAVALLDPEDRDAKEGEISLRLEPPPLGLMQAYEDDPERTAIVCRDGYYRTGDVAMRDDDGYLFYVGRADDVFKSSDYRISPFELESALLEHAAVAEAAVVPSPDPVRWTVPKAFVVLKPGVKASREIALDLFTFMRGRLAPYTRVRRLEFAELPKTISGKIRRSQLRAGEQQRREAGSRGTAEFWEDDFPELRR
jgi:acetyl-CoA synthetase